MKNEFVSRFIDMGTKALASMPKETHNTEDDEMNRLVIMFAMALLDVLDEAHR